MDQNLAFLACPPTVGGHVRRPIFESGKWTPIWVHGAVGCGSGAWNEVNEYEALTPASEAS